MKAVHFARTWPSAVSPVWNSQPRDDGGHSSDRDAEEFREEGQASRGRFLMKVGCDKQETQAGPRPKRGIAPAEASLDGGKGGEQSACEIM